MKRGKETDERRTEGMSERERERKTAKEGWGWVKTKKPVPLTGQELDETSE